jgi:thymidylate synthase
MVDDAYVKTLTDAGWPQEFNEKLEVSNLKSNLGIATLWTQKEVVSKDLDPESYVIVGQFYDRRNAIDPFLRNCLANPNIRHIILLGNDKSNSREVLVNFFDKGIADGKVVGTECSVSELIPLEDIEKFRKNVTLHDLTDKIKNLDDSEEYAKAINAVIETISDTEPYAEPKLYEKPELSVDSFPSEKVGFVVRGEKIGETWLKVLRTVYDYGTLVKMKSKDSTEVRMCQNLMITIDGEDPDNPQMEEYFRFEESYLKSYCDEICTDKVPEGTIYTYGSRLRAWEGKGGEKIDQIEDIISYLKADQFRTSAIAQTWIVEDELARRILNKDKNSPCIILVQAFAPEDKLTLTVYIRSNDMFRAWPLNMFGLRKLQKVIADGLGLKMGSLTTISCSAHIYQDNWGDTKEILDKYHKDTNCFFDPRGYFAISLNCNEIKVQHFSPDSQLLKEYSGTKAREINDEINSSQHPIDAYHSSYIGEELMKAETALRLKISYTQDEELDLSSFKRH